MLRCYHKIADDEGECTINLYCIVYKRVISTAGASSISILIPSININIMITANDEKGENNPK